MSVVTNLSKKTLTDAQISLLSKGLKFIPTRKTIDKGKLLTDLSAWERRMRLKEYFYSEDAEHRTREDEHQYKKKTSTWTPKAGRDKWQDTYIQAVKDDIICGLKRKFKYNLSKSEEQAIKELLHDDDIVIRPADKGSGIVIMDREDYVKKMKCEMSDSETYVAVTDDKTRIVENKVKKVADTLYKKGSIDSDLKRYLTSGGGTSGKLQGNPKLHKPGMPLRTIVNDRNHPTEMAEIVENELRNHVTSLPSYLRDTFDLLNKITQQPLPDGTIIFCLDEKALYPSVPREEARAAVIEALNRRMQPEVPTNDMITMMDTVLNNNTISFNGDHYMQNEGTAIGSHLGMNYASTYMGAWERELFSKSNKHPIAYFRFVDDVWGLWTHGLEALKTFHAVANEIHPRIQLELRYSTEQLEFLDTMTSIRKGRLVSDLYTKPTDRHLYLHMDSSHTESTKKAIPNGLGVRLKRICSEETDYKKHRDKRATTEARIQWPIRRDRAEES
ncbi:uncharacterized protein LOC127865763 [Dreissena polymorpha]|uniref:uncharacterized protein LOC127865763 n=1 Tax=Dreissena polymorpha TaxID=45954 RepID=UPI002265584E|nr:uncharacterized protein LOC127865763 [Dreissena polymorpha]